MKLRWLAPLLCVGVAHADVDPAGRFTHDVAISVPAYHAITPQITLRYSSGAGNGLAGVGWTVAAGSRIVRVSANHGVKRGDATDVYLLDGIELVPRGGADYATKIDSYRRIRKTTGGWEIWERDGTKRTYELDAAGNTDVLVKVEDTRLRTVKYEWTCGDGFGNCYLDAIRYAGAPGASGAEIRFARELRSDMVASAHAGLGVRERLHAIVVKMDNQLVRAYQLAYAPSANGSSILSSIEQFGRDAVVDGWGNYTAGATPALPALRLATPSLTTAASTETRFVTDSGVTAMAPTADGYASKLVDAQVTYRVGADPNQQNPIEHPHGQVTGDFDGDGRGDWLAWSISNNACTQLDIVARLMTKLAVTNVPRSTVNAGAGSVTACDVRIVVVDLNGDRRDDLLMLAGNKLTQIVATGDGAFAAGAPVPWPSKAERCAAGDVDGDGRDDLACTGDETGAITLTVARPRASGWDITTDALAGLGVAKGSHDLVAGDLDGDGLVDLTIAAKSGTQWMLHTGTSNGTGFAWASFATGWTATTSTPNPRAVDLDGDGRSDIMLGGKLAFSRKGAAGRFQLGTMNATLGATELGDFDADGRIDLFYTATQAWAHGRGDGSFDPPGAGTALPSCDVPLVVDLNGDGRSDVLCTNDTFPTYTLNDRRTPASAAHPSWLQGDISGDGAAELIHITHRANGYEITTVSTLNQARTSTIVPSTGPATFDEPDTGRFIVMDAGSPSGAPDGKSDLVLVDSHAGTLRIYTLLSNGDGTFVVKSHAPWSGTYLSRDLQHWRAATLDTDGRGDLVHVAAGGVIEALRSNGDGTWTALSPQAVAISAAGHALDMNGDGLTDFVHADGGVITTVLASGNGTYATKLWTAPAAYRDLRRVRIGDVDGDGLADLVHVARAASQIVLHVYRNAGDGSYRATTHTVSWASAVPEEANLLEDTNLVRLVDADGDRRADVVMLSSYVAAGGQLASALLVAHGGDTPAWTPALTKNLAFTAAGYDHDAWRWQPWTDPVTSDPALLYVHPTQSRALYLRPARDRITRLDNSSGGITTVEYMPLLARRTYLPEGALPIVTASVTVRDDITNVAETFQYGYGEAMYSHALGQLGFGWRTVRDRDTIELTKASLDDACGVRTTQVQEMSLAASIHAYRNYAYVAAGTTPHKCERYVDDAYECDPTACRLARRDVLAFDPYGNAFQRETTIDQAVRTFTFRPVNPDLVRYIVDRPAAEYVYHWTAAGYAAFALAAFTYNEYGERTQIRQDDDGAIRTTELAYGLGGVESITDPRGQVQTTTYDARGLVATQTCRAGSCRTLAIDPATGLLGDSTDDNGAVTQLRYDGHGRLVSSKRPTGGTTTVTYFDAQRRVRTQTPDTSADGSRWSDTITDGLGRVIRVAREGSGVVDTRYLDTSPRPHAISNANAPALWTTFQYDAAGRLERTTAPDGSQRRIAYPLGRRISTNELGVAQTSHLDGAGRVVRVDEQLGGATFKTVYRYDAAGRLLDATDQLGNVTATTYDRLGRPRTTRDPDRGTQVHTYLPNGLLATSTDAKNQTIRYTYDMQGRRTQREDIAANGAITRTAIWTWDRDQASHGAGVGRVVALTDTQLGASLAQSFVYDLDGLVTSATYCVDTSCLGMRAAYDVAGRLAALSYPDAKGSFVGRGAETLAYRYDDAGRLRSVGNYVTAIGYELDDREASVAYGNGISTLTVYDPARRWIQSVTASSPTQLHYGATYTHDLAGRIHDVTERNPTPVSLTYTFDDLGRLTNVASAEPARAERFAYDTIGRMKWSAATGDVFHDDPLHQHAPTSTDAGATRAYDLAGNLVSLREPGGRRLALAWHPDDTLASIENGGDVTTFAYDPTGTRVKKVDGSGNFTLQLGPYLELQRNHFIKYYRAGERLVARSDNGKVSYYTQDLTRSTRVTTDAKGNVENRYDYSAFGAALASSEVVAQDHEYGDGRHDLESGLVYMNARYYDPALAHFISADSIVPSLYDPQSFHRYSYAQHDPIDYWDPSGHLRASVEYKKELEARAIDWEGMEIAACAGLSSSFSAVVCSTGNSGPAMLWDELYERENRHNNPVDPAAVLDAFIAGAVTGVAGELTAPRPPADAPLVTPLTPSTTPSAWLPERASLFTAEEKKVGRFDFVPQLLLPDGVRWTGGGVSSTGDRVPKPLPRGYVPEWVEAVPLHPLQPAGEPVLQLPWIGIDISF